MDAIDRITKHFDGFGVQTVEVPEWGDENGPLVIRFTPMTLAESQRLQRIGERDGTLSRLADCLIMKALDAEGKKMFTIDHKHRLLNRADKDVLARVVLCMMASPSVEDMGKDSSRTTGSD